MSRRYGRNQKRRAREQIASLTTAVEMARGLSRHQSEQNSILRETIGVARDILGKRSLAFEPETMEMDELNDTKIRLPMRMTLANPWTGSGTMAQDLLRMFQELSVMTTDARRDELQNATHVRVAFDGHRWGYGLSDMAILNTPEHILVKRIAMELAMLIAPELKEARRPK